MVGGNQYSLPEGNRGALARRKLAATRYSPPSQLVTSGRCKINLLSGELLPHQRRRKDFLIGGGGARYVINCFVVQNYNVEQTENLGGGARGFYAYAHGCVVTLRSGWPIWLETIYTKQVLISCSLGPAGRSTRVLVQ